MSRLIGNTPIIECLVRKEFCFDGERGHGEFYPAYVFGFCARPAIVTRAEARAQGLKHFFSGQPCVHGHLAERQTVNGTCLVCLKEKATRRYAERGREICDRQRELRYANHASELAKEREYATQRRVLNRDAINAYARRWAKVNRPKTAAAWARYAAAKVLRTPPWLSKEQLTAMRSFYDEAHRRTTETGKPWHVDHIVPLRGRDVSGLHVPWNLQVIPGEENERKNNKWPT